MKQESQAVSILKNIRQHLMGGVSYMIPVVVSGGILYAIATMLSMNSVQQGGAVEASNVVIDVLSQVGSVGLGLMVPVLSAFIAMSIADRPGIAPGLICGQLAVNVGAGFIGGGSDFRDSVRNRSGISEKNPSSEIHAVFKIDYDRSDF